MLKYFSAKASSISSVFALTMLLILLGTGLTYFPPVEVFDSKTSKAEVELGYHADLRALGKVVFTEFEYEPFVDLQSVTLPEYEKNLFVSLSLKNEERTPLSLTVSSPLPNQFFERIYLVNNDGETGYKILSGTSKWRISEYEKAEKSRSFEIELNSGEQREIITLMHSDTGFISPPLVRESKAHLFIELIRTLLISLAVVIFFLTAVQKGLVLLWASKSHRLSYLLVSGGIIVVLVAAFVRGDLTFGLSTPAELSRTSAVVLMILSLFVCKATTRLSRDDLTELQKLTKYIHVSVMLTLSVMAAFIPEYISSTVIHFFTLLTLAFTVVFPIISANRLCTYRILLSITGIPVCVGLVLSLLTYSGSVPYHFLGEVALVSGVIVALVTLGFVMVLSSRSEQSRLLRKLSHDNVSSLPNLNVLNHVITQLIEEDRKFTFFTFVINGYSSVGPYITHEEKKRYLREISKRLNMFLTDSNGLVIELDNKTLPQRLGYISDGKIGFILADRDVEESLIVAKRIHSLMTNFLHLDNIAVNLSGKIGISVYPRDGQDSEQLINKSIQALNQTQNKNVSVAVYDHEKSRNLTLKMSLVSELKKAIEQNELEIYHQPQINLKTGSIYGSEVLLRWHHKERGFISPELIVSLAEEIGLMPMLTKWIITRAFEHQLVMQKASINRRISINVTASDVMQSDFVSMLLALADKYQTQLTLVTLELTESTFVRDFESFIRTMDKLSKHGVEVSIDDYGTGYSSLNYLSRFSFTELKIDRSFIDGMPHSHRNQTIVRTTVELAKALGLATVAEGVEDKETETMLVSFGVDVGQGYYYAKPMSFSQYQLYLKRKVPQVERLN
ncbi:hypothetical protein CS022_02265 [Veronia nyctiphanis]|uniref:EAL domain-containing protein n=1 Tax=Veronia nyctiphanis TaxID=1278244 RepID=A0A4Q0YTA3_9GAMM|nr:GGDEF domain-containing phosphodiesterase [Veronia nyctiphanis]RXJ74447.1 hypothetical protein CS022_02265 [Veronia nyctiphanis]